MYNHIFKRGMTSLLALMLVLLSACDVNEEIVSGIDEDPNNPTDAPAQKVFVAGQVASLMIYEGDADWISNLFTQHLTGVARQPSQYFGYSIAATDFDDMWRLAFSRAFTNLKLAQERLLDGQENIDAVIKINRAMLSGQITALWGDVPYTEAANDEVENPVYDDQMQVYSAVIGLLDEAIQTLGSGQSDLPNGWDIFSYGGDIERWLKAAYTLRARYKLHTGDLTGALADANQGIDDPTIDSNTGWAVGDLVALHGGNWQFDMNLLHSEINVDRPGDINASSSVAVAMMRPGGTRENAKTDEGSGRFLFFFTDEATPDVNLSDGGFFGASAPFPLVTYAENELIRAEILARNGDEPGALEALNNVRSYNQSRFGGTYDALVPADFQGGGAYASTTVLQEVYDEEYLSLMGQIEVFNFVRRVGYDSLSPLLNPRSGASTIPQRFRYPQSELDANENIPSPQPGLFAKTEVNGG
ncbi:MAG: SusD/RagB family nutrient-binding outer membrane lipoprotein [Balneolaceae bacterium]|jgi:hypothetical protein